MAKYKIGVTEAGDAGLDLRWESRLAEVDGAIVITKRITSDFFDAALRHKDKLIIHATVTGNGGTAIEPNVPSFEQSFISVNALVRSGFPREKVVIRVDPIIPDANHLLAALKVFSSFMSVGFTRYRVSIIDMYPHARKRFEQAGIPLPYGPAGFSPSKEQSAAVDKMLSEARAQFDSLCGKGADALRIEACAEPQLQNVIQCGCVSGYDLALLGLDASDADSSGPQRKNCLCYSGKVELLSHRTRCQNGCLYCYWR